VGVYGILMKKLLLIVILVNSNILFAAKSESFATSFTIGQYAKNYNDNLKLTKKLMIPDANSLEVTVVGKIEKNYDFLIIRDSEKKEIAKFSGVINEQFTVEGSAIFVSFKSDNRTNDKGVVVKIFSRLSGTIFNEIKHQLIDASNIILKQGTREAYIRITEHLKQFKSLQTKLNRENSESLMSEIIQSFIAVAQNYKNMAAMKVELIDVHEKQFALITSLETRTLHNIEGLEKQIQAKLVQLKKAQIELTNIIDPLEKQKIQLSIDGYKIMIQSLYAQKSVWQKFYQAQNRLEAKLYHHSQKLELLLHILNITADIYQQSANIALLGKTSLASLKNITDLSELKMIISQIVESETDIKQWIKNIKTAE
jgi:hypothetical protein